MRKILNLALIQARSIQVFPFLIDDTFMKQSCIFFLHITVWNCRNLSLIDDKMNQDVVIVVLEFSFSDSVYMKVFLKYFLAGNVGGHCLWSKIPFQSLYATWQNSADLELGQKVNSVSLVEMQPCFIKVNIIS